MMIGAYGLPGQRELVRADERSDYTLVLKQWSALTVYLTFAFLLAVINILIIGPWLGFSAGLICSLTFSIWLKAATKKKPIWFIGIIVGISVIVIWLTFGMELVELFWWDVRCNWEPRNKALFSGFSVLMLCATGLPLYRFAYEIIDPRWPPTIGIRDAEWGPMWPWASIPQEVGEAKTIRQEVVREVPRPIPTPADGHTRVLPEQPPDPARVERNGDKTMIAPSGREVRVSDLVSFIRLAPTLKPTFRSWNKRKRLDGTEWDKDTWDDVTAVWGQYGVVAKGGERETTRLLVNDFTEAMGRLSSAFD